MNKAIITLIAALLTMNIFAGEPKMICKLTSKEVKSCCCEDRPNGKMFCKLAKKEVDKCCCSGM